MHHSYEGLERTGGLARHGLLTPLRERNFRLLWTGMCVSLLGDGAFIVALAWQVYQLSDGPTAMGMVGITMTVPTIVFLLVGGVASDRFDRRRLMLMADLARLLAAAALAMLSITGALEIWHIACLVGRLRHRSGVLRARIRRDRAGPAAANLLAQANALDQFVRPIALRMAGPALGGVLVGALGAGAVFALDAASFGASAACAPAHAVPRTVERAGGADSLVTDLREGWRFVRERRWLWVTFAWPRSPTCSSWGRSRCSSPTWSSTNSTRTARDLGLVFAAGGLASIITAVAIGRHGIPRRNMTFMYLAWTAATVAVAGYGLGTAAWHLMLASAVFNALETAGTIVWITVKQRHVPSSMLGRVSSLDWLISIGLLPLSFALTGPVSDAIGARATLIGAGLLGAAVTLAGLFVPGVRAVEERPRTDASVATEPAPA